MAYPKNLLTEDEALVLDLKPHWLTIAPQALITVALLVLWIRASIGNGWLWQGLSYIAVAALVVSSLWLLAALARWFTTNFVVTSERIVVRAGVFAKSGTMTGIKSYAGYIKTVNGKTLAFALIVNGFSCSQSTVKQHMEVLLNALSKQ